MGRHWFKLSTPTSGDEIPPICLNWPCSGYLCTQIFFKSLDWTIIEQKDVWIHGYHTELPLPFNLQKLKPSMDYIVELKVTKDDDIKWGRPSLTFGGKSLPSHPGIPKVFQLEISTWTLFCTEAKISDLHLLLDIVCKK